MGTTATSNATREPVSAFIVCYNEERHIAECLKSLQFCDEILVVDSFSSDKTVEIATSLGAKVLQRAWPGYKEQKAFGLTQVNHEWVVNLDADERISPELRDSILEVLSAGSNSEDSGKEVVGYWANRVVYYLGRWWRLGGWYPEYRLRFFRKSKVTWGGIDPHEKPIVEGKTQMIKGEILHYTYDDMADHFNRLHHYASIAAMEKYKQGVKPNAFRLVVNPFFRAFKFFVLKRGFREGLAGLIVAMAEGYYTFIKYAKLWEMHYKAEEARKGE